MAEKTRISRRPRPSRMVETINDPLTRSGVEAPRKEFEGTNPE
jgi:hypothetical protein